MLAQEPFQEAEEKIRGQQPSLPLGHIPACCRDFQLASHKSHLTTEFSSVLSHFSLLLLSHNKHQQVSAFGPVLRISREDCPHLQGLVLQIQLRDPWKKDHHGCRNIWRPSHCHPSFPRRETSKLAGQQAERCLCSTEHHLLPGVHLPGLTHQVWNGVRSPKSLGAKPIPAIPREGRWGQGGSKGSAQELSAHRYRK